MPSYNCWTSYGEQGVEMEEDEAEDENIPDWAQYARFEGNQDYIMQLIKIQISPSSLW